MTCRAAARPASSPVPVRTWSCGAVHEPGEKLSWASHWNAHPATTAPPSPAPSRCPACRARCPGQE